MSRVEEVVKAVHRDTYVLKPDGTGITKTTMTETIVKSLVL